MRKTPTELFNTFDEQNPRVYELFKKLTFELIAKGIRRSSACLVINRMRWDFCFSTESEDGYKLPNQAGTGYSRKFMKEFPEHRGFFVTRRSEMDEPRLAVAV